MQSLQRNCVYCCSTLLLFIIAVACLSKAGHEQRIVGGNATTISKVPYLVNLRRNNEFICGGTIIASKCILTAAHCVYGTSSDALTVHAGASRLSERGILAQVEAQVIASNYVPATLDMDVAILRLTRSLQGSNIASIPVCRNRPQDHQYVQVSGWGLTSEHAASAPDRVRTVNVRIASLMQCRQAYAGKAEVTANMFCASVAGERDSCSGDSGGPVIYQQQVCGIVSWGFGCARTQYPGVYTNLSNLPVATFVRQAQRRYCN